MLCNQQNFKPDLMLILLQRLCCLRRGSVVLLLSSLAPPSRFASCSLSAFQKGEGRGGLGQVGLTKLTLS